MLLKDMMDEEIECVETIFLSYINSKTSTGIFLFYEGKDDMTYYRPKVKNNCNYKQQEIFDFICDGKENVLKIHKMIIEQTSNDYDGIKMFFVDSDFDDNSFLDKDIFVTPTYSIENLYFTDTAIKDMLKVIIGISDHSEDDKNDLYIAFECIIRYRDSIIEEIIYGNACFSLQIKKAYMSGRKKPNLTKLKKYDVIKGVTKFEDIKEKIKDVINITEEEIQEECLRIKENPIKFIRGKYLLEKMPKRITDLLEELNNGEKSIKKFSKKRKISIQITEPNIITVLSDCAETPQELLDYINGRLKRC